MKNYEDEAPQPVEGELASLPDDVPLLPFMVHVVQEFHELLYWKLKKVLDQEGISMLQWAFLQRAVDNRNGVPFSSILEITGETKDNVRRAAASLSPIAIVVVDPDDRRARKLVLTKRGRRRIGYITMQFEKEMLKSIGAREEISKRVGEFKSLLREALAYLTPGDLASEETIRRSRENRELIPDDSLRYVEDDTTESHWIRDDPPEDWTPF